MEKHEVHAADHPERGAHVVCFTCGWQLWLDDVPPEIVDRLSWLLDRKDEHARA